MREYGQIQCAFWTDPEIQQLSDGAARLAAYLLTGPHSNGLGCYRIPDGYIMADFGWDRATVSKRFDELFKIGFCKRCDNTGFVLIPKFMKWNPTANPKVASAREKEFNAVPTKFAFYKDLVVELVTWGRHFTKQFQDRLETVCQTVSKQEPNRTDPEPNRTETCAEPQSVSALLGESGIEILLPLNTGEEYPVHKTLAEEMQALYPATNACQELREMRAWLIANPTRRKTKSGIVRFINGWLGKAQDRAPAKPATSPPDTSHQAPHAPIWKGKPA